MEDDPEQLLADKTEIYENASQQPSSSWENIIWTDKNLVGSSWQIISLRTKLSDIWKELLKYL